MKNNLLNWKNLGLASILLTSLSTVCMGQGNLYASTQVNTLSAVTPQKNLLVDTTLNEGDLNNAIRNTKPPRTVPWFVEKFKISAGFFAPVNNTNIRVSGNGGSYGTDVDFENDLGFNKNTSTFLGDFQWRSSSRSRFDFSYYRIYRNADYVLQKDISFGDHTYPVNASVNSFFNTNIYRISYGYAILSKPTYEAGLLIGAHVVKLNLGLTLNTAIGSGTVQDRFGITAPLPDFGLWGGFSMGPKWAFNAEADYLSITIDNIHGRIIAYNAAVTFRPISSLSFAAGYTGLNFNVDAIRDRLNGELKWGYNGPSITATFAFGHHKSWNTSNEWK